MTAVFQTARRLPTRITFAFFTLLLTNLASPAHAQLVDTRATVFQTMESEIQYFFARTPDTDWRSAASETERSIIAVATLVATDRHRLLESSKAGPASYQTYIELLSD